MHAASVYPEPGSNSPRKLDLATELNLKSLVQARSRAEVPTTLQLLRCSARPIPPGARTAQFAAVRSRCQTGCRVVPAVAGDRLASGWGGGRRDGRAGLEPVSNLPDRALSPHPATRFSGPVSD